MVVKILPRYVTLIDIENLISFGTANFLFTFRNCLTCVPAMSYYSNLLSFEVGLAPRYRDPQLQVGENTHIFLLILDQTFTITGLGPSTSVLVLACT